jgi:hypothetical protein
MRQHLRDRTASRKHYEQLARERARAQELEAARDAAVAKAKAIESLDWNNHDEVFKLLGERGGWTAEKLIEAATKENDPAYKAQSLERKLQAEAERIAEEKVAKLRSEMSEREHAQIKRSAEQQFLGSLSEEKHPHLTALYEPHEIIEQAWKVINEANQRGIQASDSDIAEYLDELAKQRYARFATRTTTTIPGADSAPQARTLTAGSGSRSAPAKSLDDLDEAEQNRVLAEELRQSKRTKK